jgi:hypothetical protein
MCHSSPHLLIGDKSSHFKKMPRFRFTRWSALLPVCSGLKAVHHRKKAHWRRAGISPCRSLLRGIPKEGFVPSHNGVVDTLVYFPGPLTFKCRALG